MTKTMGRYDTDSKALKSRFEINASGALYDLEEWIKQHIDLKEGYHVLDIGCGHGKQIFKLLPLIGSAGSITGVDISTESIDKVKQTAQENRMRNVHAFTAAMDDIPELLSGKSFDVIMSAYAIYYSTDMTELIGKLSSILQPKGRIFVCGFGKDSNNEVINTLKELSPEAAAHLEMLDDFISEAQLSELAKRYDAVTTTVLENRILFPSAEAVLTWWRNHNLFVKEADAAFIDYLTEHFRHNDNYSITKNVLGVTLENPIPTGP